MHQPPGDEFMPYMLENANLMFSNIFAFFAIAYLFLSYKTYRCTSKIENSGISYFILLIGLFVAGTSLSYGENNLLIFGSGRVLVYLGAGFLPVTMYVVYRRFTVSPAKFTIIAVLSVVPIATVVLAMTNSWHQTMWAIVETGGVRHVSNVKDHMWLREVFTPYSFGLFGFSAAALAGNISNIAIAHRQKVRFFLFFAVLPFSISFANNMLQIGPISFPFTALTFVLLFPVYWWMIVRLKAHSFSPVAYHSMFAQQYDPVVVLDVSQRIICANLPAQELFNSTESNLIGRHAREFLPEASAIFGSAELGDLVQPICLGKNQDYEMKSAPLVGQSREDQGTILIFHDVSTRNQALRAIEESERFVRSTLDHSADGVLRFVKSTDSSYVCEFANCTAEKFLGRKYSAIVGAPIQEFTSIGPARILRELKDPTGSSSGSINEIVEVIDGNEVWMRVTSKKIGAHLTVTLSNITERKLNDERLRTIAFQDPLTSALNRRGLDKYGVRTMNTCKVGIVLYVDLNRFKSINDSFGREVGDMILKAFAHRLQSCLRSDDLLARLDGDQFVIAMPNISVDQVSHMISRLSEVTAEPYMVRGHELECTASIGVAHLPDQSRDLWTLVSFANWSMHESKYSRNANSGNRH